VGVCGVFERRLKRAEECEGPGVAGEGRKLSVSAVVELASASLRWEIEGKFAGGE